MLDINQQQKHISDKEIREIILQALLKQEQKYVMEYLQKHNCTQKIIVSFIRDNSHSGIDIIKLNLGNSRSKVAEHTFTSTYKLKATMDDAKSFITQYVNKLTNKDIIAIHRLIAGHIVKCKYPNLEHNLLVWIMDNYVKLYAEGSVIHVDDLRLSGHLDNLSTYLWEKYHNNWLKLNYCDLEFINKALTTLVPSNTLLNKMILKEVNNALLEC